VSISIWLLEVCGSDKPLAPGGLAIEEVEGALILEEFHGRVDFLHTQLRASSRIQPGTWDRKGPVSLRDGHFPWWLRPRPRLALSDIELSDEHIDKKVVLIEVRLPEGKNVPFRKFGHAEHWRFLLVLL